MKRAITISFVITIIFWSTVSYGNPDLSGEYWFGSLSVDIDTNAPMAKRGTVSIIGDQWDQEWDDYNGHHTFSSVVISTVQPDGSININFPGETYNIAWNGDVMIHAGSVLGGGGEGIDIFTRKANSVDIVNDVLGDHRYFAHHLDSPDPGDSCNWGNFTFDANGTATGTWMNDQGVIESALMDWTIDDINATVTVWGPTINDLGYATSFLGEGGIGSAWQIVPEEGRGDLGYSIFIKQTDQLITLDDIAGTYLVRFLETGPGGVPYTCGQGTGILEADGSLSVDAYYSNGEHDVFTTDCTVGPGNTFYLGGEEEGIINQNKNLIFIPEYRYENPPARTDYDWVGGIFLIRTQSTDNNIVLALLEELIQQVIDLDLQHGTENSLLAKLDAAIKVLENSNEKAIINSLEAFIHTVSAQSGKKIVAEDADELIASAQHIIDVLNSD